MECLPSVCGGRRYYERSLQDSRKRFRMRMKEIENLRRADGAPRRQAVA